MVRRVRSRRSERLATSRADLPGRAYRALCTPARECLRVRWMHPIAGGPMPSGDEIRDVQRATWAELSAGWEKWDSVIMDQLGPVGTAIIERLDIADDQQHLDIAAGTGEPGLTVAKLAPRGRVVLTDLAALRLRCSTSRRDERTRKGSPILRPRCAAPTTCHSVTRHSTVSRYGSDTCFFLTSPKRPPSSRACLSRADVSAPRYGSSPRKTRGRRSPCRQSRRRRCWRHPTRTGRICSGALPRDMSVPCTRPRGCATLPSGTSTSNS